MWIANFYFLLLSLIHFNYVTATRGTKPFINKQPTDYIQKIEESATLDCEASGDPKPTITWHHAEDGRRVLTAQDLPTDASIASSKSGTLIFLAVLRKDQGLYYCNASNENGWTISRNASLRIAFIDSAFENQPQNKLTTVDSTVELMCRAPQGLPAPKVRWKKDGKTLTLTDRVKVTNEGDLRIDRAELSDNGRYTCEAFNLAGRYESEPAAILSVRIKPIFNTRPSDDNVQVGDNTTFFCEASGDPSTSITWKREEGRIASSRSRILPNGALHITNVQLNDAGKYICVAKSSAGIVEAIARLDVNLAPQFVLTPSNQVAKKGEVVTFRCKAIGHPKVTIYWANNLKKFIFAGQSDETGRRNVSKDGTSLTIYDVSKSDEGSYECHATNPIAFKQTSVTLSVSQINSGLPPLIEYGPQNLTLRKGARAILHCVVRGGEDDDYLPSHSTLTWYRGATIASSRRVLYENDSRFRKTVDGTLQIDDVRREDQDNYTCVVRSGDKSTRWTAQLRVLDEADHVNREVKPNDIAVFPSAPKYVQIYEKGSDWLKLKWYPPYVPRFLSAVNSYRVEYISHETGQGWQVVEDLVPAAGEEDGFISYVVKNLRPETGYQFVVRAINKEGLSKPSILTQNFRTLAKDDMPIMSPNDVNAQLKAIEIRNIKLKVISSKSVRVDWEVNFKKPRRSSISPISGFRIRYKKMPLEQCVSRVDAASTNNEQQEDQDADAASLSKQYADSSINERLHYCSMNPKYDAYRKQQLQFDKTSGDGKSIDGEAALSITVNSEASRKRKQNAVVSQLQPFQCFMITIDPYYYHRMYGEIPGGRSPPEFVLTYDEPPSGPPTDIKANWSSNSSAVVSWQPPAIVYRNGVLLGYVIHILTNDSRTHHRMIIDELKTNATIIGLSPTYSYTIHLACFNCKGEGVRSEAFLLRRLVIANPTNDDEQRGLLKQPWFIPCVVIGIIVWLMFCGLVGYVCYYKSTSYKRSTMYKSYANGSLTKTEQCNMHPLLKSEQPLDSSSCGSRLTHQSATSTAPISNNVIGVPDLTQQFMFEKRGFDLSSTANLSPTLLRYKGHQSYQSNPVAPYATTSLIQNMINMPTAQSYSESSCTANGLMNGSANSGMMSGQQHQQPCGTYSDSTRTGTCSECGSHTGDDETNFGRRGAWGQNSPRGKPLNIGELIPPPPIDPPPMIMSLHSINGVVALPLTCPCCSASLPGCRCNSSQKASAAAAGLPVVVTTQQSSGMFSTPPQPRTSPPRLQQTAVSNITAAANLRQGSASPKPSFAGSQLHHLHHMSDMSYHHSSHHGKSGSSYSSGTGSNLPSCSETEAASQQPQLHQPRLHNVKQHSSCVTNSTIQPPGSVDNVIVGLEDISNLRSRSPANSSLQGEGDGSVTSSVIASWTTLHTGAGTSLAVGHRCNAAMDHCIVDDDEELDSSEITSLNSESDCSDPDEGDKSFLAEAEFATALAQAVEANGLASSSCERATAAVPHSQHHNYLTNATALHPQTSGNWAPRKKRRHHQRMLPRPESPYSTDSNYSVLPPAPPRPYPKSERRRQMKTYGLHNESSASANQQAFETALKQKLQQSAVAASAGHSFYDMIPQDKHIV